MEEKPGSRKVKGKVKGKGGRPASACTNCKLKKRHCDGDGVRKCRHCAQRQESCSYASTEPRPAKCDSSRVGARRPAGEWKHPPIASACRKDLGSTQNREGGLGIGKRGRWPACFFPSTLDAAGFQQSKPLEWIETYPPPEQAMLYSHGRSMGTMARAHAPDRPAEDEVGLATEVGHAQTGPRHADKCERGRDPTGEEPYESLSDAFIKGSHGSTAERVARCCPDTVGPTRRPRLSPSPAAGLSGLMESVFLETFFTHFVSFLPGTFGEGVQEALSSLMIDSSSIVEDGNFGVIGSNAVRKKPGDRNIRGYSKRRRGSDAMIVIGHTKYRGNALMATMWKSIAIGAVLQGCGQDLINRYIALGEHCLMTESSSTKGGHLHRVHALLLRGCLADSQGDTERFSSSTHDAIAALGRASMEEQGKMRPVVMWFELILSFDREVPVWDTPSTGVCELSGCHPTIGGLCEPLARELRHSQVAPFLMALDTLYMTNVSRPGAVHPFQYKPILEALKTIGGLAGGQGCWEEGWEIDSSVCAPDTSALINMHILFWVSFIFLLQGKKGAALKLSLRFSQILERVPGVSRLTVWMYRCQFAAFQLAKLGSPEDYNHMCSIFNKHCKENPLPPLAELSPWSKCCILYPCKNGLHLLGLYAEEQELQHEVIYQEDNTEHRASMPSPPKTLIPPTTSSQHTPASYPILDDIGLAVGARQSKSEDSTIGMDRGTKAQLEEGYIPETDLTPELGVKEGVGPVEGAGDLELLQQNEAEGDVCPLQSTLDGSFLEDWVVPADLTDLAKLLLDVPCQPSMLNSEPFQFGLFD